jgi:NAD(P)-dependent dehydrogenase (short-subunit alcohol dehydrogenase family)
MPGSPGAGQSSDSLAGKVAVVTGAGRGIGRASALALAAQGVAVVINAPGGDISGSGSEPTVADAVVAEITERGGKAAANHQSVSSLNGAEAIVDTAIDRFGAIDILVNNAGISRQNMIWDMPARDFDEMLATHLKGAWNCTKAVVPHLIGQRSGSIVNMSSGVAVIGAVANCGYTAAKAGVIGLTFAAAMDLGPYGIRVNALFPAAASRLDDKHEPWRDRYPTTPRPTMDPDAWPAANVAAFVAFLASEEAKAINGQLFTCGGDSIAAYPLWQPDAVISKAGGHWTQSELAERVPAELLVGKPNPSPPQDDPMVWPWVRQGGLPATHAQLESKR